VATIQVRDVPAETYRVIRLRAKSEGKSLQAYMRDVLIELAGRRTKDEAAEAIKRLIAEHRPVPSTPEEIVADIAAGRR
jgi:plasmid stability protein